MQFSGASVWPPDLQACEKLYNINRSLQEQQDSAYSPSTSPLPADRRSASWARRTPSAAAARIAVSRCRRSRSEVTSSSSCLSSAPNATVPAIVRERLGSSGSKSSALAPAASATSAYAWRQASTSDGGGSSNWSGTATTSAVMNERP